MSAGKGAAMRFRDGLDLNAGFAKEPNVVRPPWRRLVDRRAASFTRGHEVSNAQRSQPPQR